MSSRNIAYLPFDKMHYIALQFRIAYKQEDAMESQVTVRLPETLNKNISAFARKMRLKRSDIIRLALENFVGSTQTKENDNPFERVKDLIGSISSGAPDLGTRHREHLISRIRKIA